ncbi:hypothetical protein FDE76_01465 [Clostridium botulinum]|uniref:Uncharacterized protein n=1 Tax=Clostridium botulinum (strain Eklund 17B / Type B) TaxID=935198 RepID=B2TMH4_CLOBB|nr:hypothetical protein CLL_A0961 [Clostridium botulinum B str. Eklund 17B (NRP)]MBY6975205.1 hypothetical protein [Clostridium botulinum]MBY7000186.1 hypothetical protein [Clostridium botulinum]MCR1274961.1 hypothetical protein [Clostridium botulinum]NFD68757.1 hypothetical protein [Clostridium botulinum]
MTIEEIKQQLDFLSDKIDLINVNLQFNITTFLAILSIALVIAGTSSVILAKYLFNKRFDIEIKKIDDKIKQMLIDEPPILSVTNTIISLTLNIEQEDNGKTIYRYKGLLILGKNVTKQSFISSEFYHFIPPGIRKEPLENYKLDIKNKVHLEIIIDCNQEMPKWWEFIEVNIAWKNPIYETFK